MAYPKIPQEQYDHLLFSLRGQFNAILNPLRCYGLEPYVDQAVEECIIVAERFGQAVRGDDKPIHIYNEYKPKVTE